jgi:hypothetical protein
MKTPAIKPELETTFVPVVTMEEVPVLSDEEREELIASLKEAEADIAAGRATTFDRESFRARFMAICRGEID